MALTVTDTRSSTPSRRETGSIGLAEPTSAVEPLVSGVLARAPAQVHAELRFYRPELDALRLGAFLMVWLAHSLPTESEGAARGVGPVVLAWIEAIRDAGNFGVCVFFFLSAYLVTELLRRERLATGTIHLRAFYLRRILRIWPLYLGVLAAYGLLGLHFHGFRIEPGRLLASLLLAGNWYIFCHPAILTPMRALWSLSVEEQFYLGWPLIARFASRSVAAVSIAFLLSAQAMLLWLTRSGAPQGMLHVTAWVNSLVQFQFFAWGALTAIGLSGRQPNIKSVLRIVMLLAAVVAMLVASGVCHIKRAQAVHGGGGLIAGYLLVGCGCVLLFAAVLGCPPRWTPGWLSRLGQVSFGLYVFHETGFFLAGALSRRLAMMLPRLAAYQTAHWALALTAEKLLSLAFTLCLARVSYRYWEQPFLRLKSRFTFVPSRQPVRQV